MLLAICSSANDAVYMANGSFLVPTVETSISVQKEVLTITLGKDGYANVDVYYEFMNNDSAKTVTMAFEAAAPYNDDSKFNAKGIHPNIRNFTVTMNDKRLPFSNGIVALSWQDDMNVVNDHSLVDLKKWRPSDDCGSNGLYCEELDSFIVFAYAYYFDAHFKPGVNIVHHTYRYKMGYSVAASFNVPYWLTPATRWANGQVDDFTLRIQSEDLSQGFCFADSLFTAAPFTRENGIGQIYEHISTQWGTSYVFVANGDCLQWHTTNFRPTDNLVISSCDLLDPSYWLGNDECGLVVVDKDGNEYTYVGERGDEYFVSAQDYGFVLKQGAKVVEYTSSNGEGWLVPRAKGKIKIRTAPKEKSPVLCVIKGEGNELPECHRCLGIEDGGWYKVKVGDSEGYVQWDDVYWTPICTF